MCQCAAIGFEYCPVGELLLSLLTDGLAIQRWVVSGPDAGFSIALAAPLPTIRVKYRSSLPQMVRRTLRGSEPLANREEKLKTHFK
jgi:hypothetical protein